MTNVSESPVCVAVVVCGDYIEDKRTNNKSLIGLFNAITVTQVPSTQPRMVVMASVTNSSGTVPIRLVIKAPSGAEVAAIPVDFTSGHPLAVHDLVFEIGGLIVPELGTYHIDLLSGSRYLGGRRFDVILAPAVP